MRKTILGSNHQGGALQNMVKEYPSVPAVAKELVQNSIDVDFGGAKKIELVVNYDEGTMTYLDNGPGLTDETFEQAVKTFGHSIKRGDKYGRFGIGLASPLSIATHFSFVTAPSGHRYRSYTFDREKLFSVVSGGYPIVVDEVDNFVHGDGKTPGVRRKTPETVWWRTGIFMTGLTADKQKRRLDVDTFQEDIQSAYSKKLVELDTKITVRVIEGGVETCTEFKAKLYQGAPLPVWSVKLEDVGTVAVKLYLAPIGYSGPLRLDIGSGNNPSRVGLSRMFLTHNFYACLSEATKAALKSGLFQGEFIGENLQLLTNRRGFAQDDALFAFAVALDQWYNEVGSKYYNDEKRQRLASRYQTIGLAAIERLKSTLLGPESPFASILALAEFGSIGKGHAVVPKSTLTGQEMMAKAIGGQKGDGHGSKGGSRGNREQPQHHPDVVAGPEGHVRHVVKGHSTGLHMTFTDTGERMFWFNPMAACITINNTHPTFVLLEKSDRHLERYYMMLIIAALRLELESDERVKDAQHSFMEDFVRDWAGHVLIS